MKVNEQDAQRLDEIRGEPNAGSPEQQENGVTEAEDSTMLDSAGDEDVGTPSAAGEDASEIRRDEAAHSDAPADDHPLELVQQLEYVKPAAGEKKSKKQAEDEDDGGNLTLTSVSEARAVLEGYLFTSNEPLSVQRLSKLMNNLQPRTVRGLLLELQMDYDNRAGALQVVEIAGGFQMATRPHLADWMFRMHRHKRRSALSPATLETLAIVAYKQPITKGEIEAIRGVESSGTVRTLQDLNMVEAAGRREVVGRPQLFVTTEQFLKAFGLKSLADLPSISELRNLFSNEQKLQRAVAAPPQANEENPTELSGESDDAPEPGISEDEEPSAHDGLAVDETQSPETADAEEKY